MRFPGWVEHEKTPQKRASARLRYILGHLALQISPRASLIALGEHVGVDNSTLSCHMRDGACTPRSAMLIVAKLGDSFVTAQQLCDPLSIKNEAV